MDRDDRDDPFGDFFEEIERMMNEMANGNPGSEDAGFGSATHVDAYTTDDGVRLVADLPAVSKDELSLQCDGEALTISAASDRREYDETVELPVRSTSTRRTRRSTTACWRSCSTATTTPPRSIWSSRSLLFILPRRSARSALRAGHRSRACTSSPRRRSAARSSR